MPQAGLFEAKALPARSLQDLAAAYVAYVVLGNVSLRINPVGFYQITKICIAPTVMVCEAVADRTLPSPQVLASVSMLSVGITLATVTDSQVRVGITASAPDSRVCALDAARVQHGCQRASCTT